jgi:Uma2 family endonuclease
MSTIVATEIRPETANETWIPSPLYRISVEKYEAMVEAGVFTPRDRFHLINGYLVEKMTQNDPRSTGDELCGIALTRSIPEGWHVRAAKPIRLPAQASKPEPDRSVVCGSVRDYSRQSPGASDISIVVEVADSGLQDDRKLAKVYAAAGIPIYWILNLIDGQVEVYTNPSQDGYASRQDYRSGQSVPVIIDGTEVARFPIAELLP